MSGSAAYVAARESAAVFDRPGRGRIAVAGDDRRSYLHAMLTNDILSLAAGTGCYAAYLTPQGRLIADMTVLELGDVILLDLERQATSEVLTRLAQYVFSEDVRFGDLSEAFAGLTVVGPAAAAVTAAVVTQAGGAALDAGELNGWPAFRNLRGSFRGEVVVVARSDEIGVPAFDLLVERPRLQDLGAALASAGAVPGAAADWDTLRVEAGRPAFGIDMDSSTIPLEAGIERRAISFTKGCYPGQEVIVRVVRRGHGRIARKLVGLEMAGADTPAAGDGVRSGDREAGRVTSAVFSPRVGGPIALAMVARDFFSPATALSVVHGGREIPARVVDLPFVRG
jgi:folate-binding protein YgfZ